MAFDGIVLKQVTSELANCLIGGKINKIYQPNNNEIILSIYSGSKNYALLCNISSNNYRIHLTTNSKPNPLNAPHFCMLLRKHLIGYKIKNIYTLSLERIAFIELEGYNELNDLLTKTLVVELMGKHSNIILLNQNNKIIDSLRHLDVHSGSLRDIMPARDYTFVSSCKEDFYKTSEDVFVSKINEDIIKSISNNFTGISSCFISNLLETKQISNAKYEKSELNILYNEIYSILSSIGSCNIICSNTSSNDYTIIAGTNNDSLQTNFFLDDFYSKKEINESLLNYRNNLLRIVLASLKKISKKIANINQKLSECNSMEQYRIYGELITSNLYRINSNENTSSITIENFYDENNLITIPLDSTISISYNAKKFFKKYHKLKNTLKIVTEQKNEAEQELDYLESIIYELENATNISELDEIYQEICEYGIIKNNSKANVQKNKVNKKKCHNEYEPILYTVDGFSLFVGKNNKQNDYISTKLGKNEDLWFHTKDIRGSHCLLKCNGSHPEEHTILACAQIAAYYSKAKLSSNVAVDFCFIKHVKKPSKSKPGMVIYSNNKTLYVDPQVPVNNE